MAREHKPAPKSVKSVKTFIYLGTTQTNQNWMQQKFVTNWTPWIPASFWSEIFLAILGTRRFV